MAIHRTFEQAKRELSSLLDNVTQDRETVVVNRSGKEAVAIIAASELAGLIETVHLLRSPKNAERLLTALLRAIDIQ